MLLELTRCTDDRVAGYPAHQAGAARLLFGMGRDSAVPRKLFAHIDPKYRVPTYNIWLIGLIAFLGAMFLNGERAAESRGGLVRTIYVS